MAALEDGHRRVSPGRESTGTDFYTVLRYDPIWQVCDLASASSNQRGTLRSVPIGQPFGGAWELQTFHKPALERVVEPAHWGECPRGPRWGQSLPIQEGDMARVSFGAEGSSDPVITGFMRWRGDYGIPWVANQVLGDIKNDYTEQTPLDDDILADRWDILLPSGAWMRSTESGSWTIATAPTHRAVAWASLGFDGKIKIKSRDDEAYKFHAEFDPVSQEGRIVLGKIEDGSYIEFKDGNIHIRAKGDIKFYSNNAEFNCTDQGAIEGAANVLTKLKTHLETGSGEVQELLTQAVGELAVQSGDPLQAKTVINNSQIPGAVRNTLNNAAANPEPLRDGVLNSFQEGQGTPAIARRLTQLVGADVLTDRLPAINFNLDLTSGFLTDQLGIPSTTLQTVSNLLRDNPFIPQLAIALGQSPGEILAQLSQFTGGNILNGATIAAARTALTQAVPAGLSATVQQVLTGIGSIPLASPGGGNPILAVAQALGKYVLSGNRRLGGDAQLFDYDVLSGLDLPADTIASVTAIARQIENYVGYPYPAVTPSPLTDAQLLAVNQFAAFPVELRSAIADLPPEQRPLVRDLIAADPATLANQYAFEGGAIGEVASLIGSMPEFMRTILEEFEGFEVLGELRTPPDAEVLRDPRLTEGLPEMVIQSLFAGASTGAGVFHVRVASYALFSQDPVPAPILEPWQPREFHLVTEATEIERFTEYGDLNMPDYW